LVEFLLCERVVCDIDRV